MAVASTRAPFRTGLCQGTGQPRRRDPHVTMLFGTARCGLPGRRRVALPHNHELFEELFGCPCPLVGAFTTSRRPDTWTAAGSARQKCPAPAVGACGGAHPPV